MAMTRVLYISIICIGILISCSIIPGCVNSHTTEINHAKSLVKSAESRLSFMKSANFTTLYVGQIRANASAAKSDMTEAKNILVQIPQNELSPQDQADMKVLLAMLDIDIELADILGNSFADVIEDAQTVLVSKDPTAVTEAGLKMKQDILVLNQKISSLSARINSISETGLSPELKGDLIGAKTLLTSASGDINKLNNQARRCMHQEMC